MDDIGETVDLLALGGEGLERRLLCLFLLFCQDDLFDEEVGHIDAVLKFFVFERVEAVAGDHSGNVFEGDSGASQKVFVLLLGKDLVDDEREKSTLFRPHLRENAHNI